MDLSLRKKYTFRVDGAKIILIKKSYESEFHVLAKALVYSLYHQPFPGLQIEVGLAGRYKPDVLATDEQSNPIFWAECGMVKPEKIRKLFSKYHGAHFVFVKKRRQIPAFTRLLHKLIKTSKHPLNVELIEFPEQISRFIDENGCIEVNRSSLKILLFS